jgi:copper resistance protein B
MFIKNIIKILLLILIFPKNLLAKDGHIMHGGDYPVIFHAFTIEAEVGESRDGKTKRFDLDGWIGGDFNRLWIKSEQKSYGSHEKKSEVQALYSRNISDFWDAQIGIRHDFRAAANYKNIDYLTIGLEGLAIYGFETSAQIFLSQDGDYSARLEQEIDILITQKLVLKPYYEINLFASDVVRKEVKSGLTEFEAGILTSWEINRKLAPYFALRWEAKTFDTKNLAQKNNKRTEDFIASIGIRAKF